MNNNSNKSITTMAIALTIALVFLVGSTTDNVMAKKQLTGQQRYDSGYKDGIKDCGNENIIQNYMQTSAYIGHSDLYHQGYVDGAYSCGNGGGSNNNNNSHLTSVSAPDNNQNGYSQNDNNNNRDQTQGQANNQHVVCIIAIGTCPTTSGQAQSLTN